MRFWNESASVEVLRSTLVLVRNNFKSSIYQGLGIFFLRINQDILCGASFNNVPMLHDKDIVAKSLDDLQIMADEQIGKFVFVTKILEKVYDLRLYRKI